MSAPVDSSFQQLSLSDSESPEKKSYPTTSLRSWGPRLGVFYYKNNALATTLTQVFFGTNCTTGLSDDIQVRAFSRCSHCVEAKGTTLGFSTKPQDIVSKQSIEYVNIVLLELEKMWETIHKDVEKLLQETCTMWLFITTRASESDPSIVHVEIGILSGPPTDLMKGDATTCVRSET